MQRLWSLLVLGLFVSSPVGAQEPASRADEHAKKQQEKAGKLTPYKPNPVERQVLAIENAGGFAAPRGFLVAFGDIKAGSGPALGPGYARALGNGTVYSAKTVYSTRNFKLAQIGLQSPALAGGRLRLSTRARWQDAPVLRVYALGINSPNTRGDYSETKTEVSGEAAFRPIRLLRFGAGTGFEAFDTGPGDSGRPPVETLFGQLPGLYADPDYLHSFASAGIDSRDGDGYSRSGSFLGATVHDYRQQNDGPYSFRRVDATAEQYLPLLHGNWVLFLNARVSTTTTSDGNTVPFFLMPALGGSRSLRAYHSYRFRDRNSIIFTGEYRWYAQEFLDVALFYDAGKLTSSKSELGFSGLKSDVGIGIRFHGSQTTALRIDLAHGDEGYHLMIAFSPAGR